MQLKVEAKLEITAACNWKAFNNKSKTHTHTHTHSHSMTSLSNPVGNRVEVWALANTTRISWINTPLVVTVANVTAE